MTSEAGWREFAEGFTDLGPIYARRDVLERDLTVELSRVEPGQLPSEMPRVFRLMVSLRALLRLGVRIADLGDFPTASLVKSVSDWAFRLSEARFSWILHQNYNEEDERAIQTEAEQFHPNTAKRQDRSTVAPFKRAAWVHRIEQ